MSKDKIEFIHKLTTDEAARYLRDIADSLENGSMDLDSSGLEWNEIRELEMSLQNRDGRVSLKTEVKPWTKHRKGKHKDFGPGDTTGGRQKPFKALKKDMEKTFKGIRSSLRQDSLPTPEEARELQEQALEMERQAGPGREEYLAFIRLAEGLAQAVTDGDLERSRGLLGDLEGAEKECHAKCK